MEEEGNPVPIAAEPDPRFTDLQQEQDYQATSELLVNPPRVQAKGRILLISLAVFVIVSLSKDNFSIAEMATLVGVLLVHELGHALGMLVFGYSDVRIFFIPFFGAAASGRKRGVARWKEGVVLLMGPLPGLVAGMILLATGATGLLHTVALQLAVINGFNLLPLTPLDGGQLFQLILFSRNRHTEVAFQAVAAIAMFALSAIFKLYLLAILSVFILVRIPFRRNLLAIAHELRAQNLPTDPRALDDTQRRSLFAHMWRAIPVQWRNKPRAQATIMEQLLESATRRPTGLGASAGLFVGWAAGLAVAIFTAYVFLGHPPANWQRYEDQQHQFSIEFPATPKESTTPQITGGGVLGGVLGRDVDFAVTWVPIANPAWRESVRKAFAEDKGTLLREVAMPEGDPALIIAFQGKRSWILIRGDEATAFVVVAIGNDADSEREIRSFRLLPH